MPGIFGVLGDSGRDSHFCGRVTAVHDLPGLDFAREQHSSEHCTLLAISRPNSKSKYLARDARSGAILIWEGELYEDRSSGNQAADDSSSMADDLLRAFLETGSRFVERLDGEFNIAVFERDRRRISLFSDGLGSYPLYYWNTPTGFYFGSEKKCVLAACHRPRSLDPIALLQPFVHQHNLGDRTLIDGLKRMPPSSQVIVEDGRLAIHSYGSQIHDRSDYSDADGLLDAWGHRLRVATQKRLTSNRRLLISLSSGLDSRAVSCALDREWRPVSARTMGHLDSFEVRYAAQIADALHFDHVIEDSLQFKFSDVIHQIIWRTDGETDFRNGLSMAAHASSRSLGDDIMGGWLGDVTSGAHLRPFMLRPMKRVDFVGKVFRWYVQHTPEQLQLVFRKEFLREQWPMVKQAFVESYAPYRDLPNPNAHEMWDIRNRQTRMTVSSMPVDSYLFGKVRPFFDRQYLQFAMSIPLKWRVGQNLYKSLINRIGPEIRSIPNGNTNVRLHGSPVLNLAGYGMALGNRLLARIGNKVGSRRKNPGSTKVATEIAAHFRKDVGLRRIIESFVVSHAFDDEIFNRAGIGAMLDQHYSGSADHSELICILASYAIALDYFFHGTPSVCPQEAVPVL